MSSIWQLTMVITPVYKGSGYDPEDLKNYRPVPNLKLLDKLLERIVLKRLLNHLNDEFDFKFRSWTKCGNINITLKIMSSI